MISSSHKKMVVVLLTATWVQQWVTSDHAFIGITILQIKFVSSLVGVEHNKSMWESLGILKIGWDVKNQPLNSNQHDETLKADDCNKRGPGETRCPAPWKLQTPWINTSKWNSCLQNTPERKRRHTANELVSFLIKMCEEGSRHLT